MMDKKVYHDRDFGELLEKSKHNIEKYGLQVISIKASNYLPSFSYSIGPFCTSCTVMTGIGNS